MTGVRFKGMLLLLLIGLLSAPGSTYELMYDGSVGPLKFRLPQTTMYLSSAAFPSGSNVWAAARNALQTWSKIDGCGWRFNRVDGGSPMPNGFGPNMHGDGYTDIFALTVADSQGTLDSSTYAVTINTWLIGTSYFDDADVIFNADMTWSTDGNPNYPDVETVALHEFGHVLGLDHENALTSAVMYPYGTDGQVSRVLTTDDMDGARELYPGEWYTPPPPPPPPGPTAPPVVRVDLKNVSLSAMEVRVGDVIRVTGTVENPNDEPATVSSLVMNPGLLMKNQNIVLDPKASESFDIEAIVRGSPGRYRPAIHAIGYDGANHYRSNDASLDDDFTVARNPLGYTLQDSLTAELGPGGVDVLNVPLLKGSKLWIEVKVSDLVTWPGERLVEVRDPNGKIVRSAKSGRTVALKQLKVKKNEGMFTIRIENLGPSAGRYVLVTSGTPPRKKVRAKARIEPGETRAELVLPPLPARCEIEGYLTLKGTGTRLPRITGYRLPSGFLIELKTPLDRLAGFPLTESGSYTLLIDVPEDPSEPAPRKPKRLKLKLKGGVSMSSGLAHQVD